MISAPLHGTIAIVGGCLLFGAAGHAGTPTPLTKSDVSIYGKAYAAATAGHWRQAHRHAKRAQKPLPAKVLHWMDMTRNGTRRSFRDIAAFIDENPDWPYQRLLRRRAEEAMTDKTSPARVLAWFGAHPPQTTDGRIRLIDALLKNGDKKRAAQLIRETWVTGSFGRKQENRFRRRFRRYLGKTEHAARLDRLLWRGNFVQARRAVRRVDKPTQHLAMARIALRTFRGGVDWHIRQVPASLKSDLGLRFERARWRRRKGRDQGAYDILRDIPSSAPNAELWWNERSIIARRLLAKGHVSEAYRLASANGLSKGARFVEAEWLAGWVSLRFLDDARVARGHFERIRGRVKYPISKARAAYWTARAAEAAGDKDAAALYREAAGYSTTYYGQLAAARDGGLLSLASSEVRPSGPEIARFNTDERVLAVLMLNQIGAADYLRPFLDTLVDGADNPVRQLLTARLAKAIGRLDLSVRAGRKAYRAGAALPSVAYPVIEMPSGNPEQALLHAVARQESNFDRTAVSRAGARGLMQLMPRTAKSVARRLRVPYSRNRLIRDPDYNIRIGRAYLGQLLDRFDGSYVLAVAAYNAGPGSVSRWIKKNGDPRDASLDAIDWIEMIPYRETRNYVQRVIENLQIYRMRMNGRLVARAIERDLKR